MKKKLEKHNVYRHYNLYEALVEDLIDINEKTGEITTACNDDIIREFTGLVDSNGREVYNGDIYKNNENGLIGVLIIYNSPTGGNIVWSTEFKDG